MIAVNFKVGPRMMLRSGAWFDFLDPGDSDFTIEDIAFGLSNICRYSGQCSEFYSVAEHSLLVANVTPDHAYSALMHDAAEAFIGDITRPLKQLLPDFKRIESSVEQAVFERFHVPNPMPKAVKAADLRVLAAEQIQIMPPETSRWSLEEGVDPAPVKVRHLPPKAAREAFLERFRELAPSGPQQRVARVV